MTVRYHDGMIYLEGRCLVEDADELLTALRKWPSAPVELSGARRVHMSVVQVLLSLRPKMTGTPAQPFLAAHVLLNLGLPPA